MGIRSTLASVIGGDAVDTRVRQTVEEVLASKGFARPADLQELRERVNAVQGGAIGEPADPELGRRVAALENEIASLRKKLNMAMGAIQAATAQLADARRAADEARAEARQAHARAESALATAESLSDGVEALEAAVESGAAAAPTPSPEDAPADDRIDLNSADAETLKELNGIGPSMAVRIVEDRAQNGRFHSVSDLSRVKGLGAATVKRLEDRLKV